MITVKDLIEKLKQFDGNMPVLLYDRMTESSSVACGVGIETEETQHYTNGDHAFFYNRQLKKNQVAVTIVGDGLC
jgi:hypothetical protein